MHLNLQKCLEIKQFKHSSRFVYAHLGLYHIICIFLLFTYVTKGGHYGGQSSYQEKNKRR